LAWSEVDKKEEKEKKKKKKKKTTDIKAFFSGSIYTFPLSVCWGNLAAGCCTGRGCSPLAPLPALPQPCCWLLTESGHGQQKQELREGA